jgi:hypothetical protein
MNAANPPSWQKRSTRIVNGICLATLLVVMGTVIYGLILRASFERSYYAAVVVSIMGAMVIIIGLAQQAIAARDALTWREMAEWQIRAAAQRISVRASATTTVAGMLGPDSDAYYDQLIETLLDDMQGSVQLGGAR